MSEEKSIDKITIADLSEYISGICKGGGGFVLVLMLSNGAIQTISNAAEGLDEVRLLNGGIAEVLGRIAISKHLNSVDLTPEAS